MRRPAPSRATWKAAAIALATGLLVAACSSASTSPGAASTPTTSAAASSSASVPPTASAALCQQVAALRTSLSNLTHIKVSKDSVNEIKSNLADVQSKLNALTAQARGQWHSQTTDLKAALDKLHTATSDLAASPGISTVAGVVTALGGVTSAASSLFAATSAECPSASSSPST